MLGMDYDRNEWKKIIVERINEYSRRLCGYGLGIHERELEYIQVKSQPKNKTYTSGNVEMRVRLMVRGCCLLVKGSKGKEMK